MGCENVMMNGLKNVRKKNKIKKPYKNNQKNKRIVKRKKKIPGKYLWGIH